MKTVVLIVPECRVKKLGQLISSISPWLRGNWIMKWQIALLVLLLVANGCIQPLEMHDITKVEVDGFLSNPAEITVDESPLLSTSIDSKLQDELDKGRIPADLRTQLKKNQIYLSENAAVSVRKKGSKWLIIDRDNKEKYTVRKEKGKLNVARPYLGIVHQGGLYYGSNTEPYDLLFLRNARISTKDFKRLVQAALKSNWEIQIDITHVEGGFNDETLDLGNTVFSKRISVEETTFHVMVDFNNTTFSADANFNNTTFLADANFSNTQFLTDANFASTIFSGKADFIGVIFSGKADFAHVAFMQRVNFSYAPSTSSREELDFLDNKQKSLDELTGKIVKELNSLWEEYGSKLIEPTEEQSMKKVEEEIRIALKGETLKEEIKKALEELKRGTNEPSDLAKRIIEKTSAPLDPKVQSTELSLIQSVGEWEVEEKISSIFQKAGSKAAQFSGEEANFDAAIFSKGVNFRNVTFFGGTFFSRCQFKESSDFRGCLYPENLKISFYSVTVFDRVLIEWKQDTRYDMAHNRDKKRRGLKGHLEYDEPFYTVLIDNYKDMGWLSQANDVSYTYRVEKRKIRSKEKLYYTGLAGVEVFLFDFPLGYGFKPERFFISLLVVWFIFSVYYYYLGVQRHGAPQTRISREITGLLWAFLHSFATMSPKIDLYSRIAALRASPHRLNAESKAGCIWGQRVQKGLGWYLLGYLFSVFLSKIWG